MPAMPGQRYSLQYNFQVSDGDKAFRYQVRYELERNTTYEEPRKEIVESSLLLDA